MPLSCALFECKSYGGMEDDQKKNKIFKVSYSCNSKYEKYQNIFNPFNKSSDNLEKFNNLRLERQEKWINDLKQGVLNESFIRYARVCNSISFLVNIQSIYHFVFKIN